MDTNQRYTITRRGRDGGQWTADEATLKEWIANGKVQPMDEVYDSESKSRSYAKNFTVGAAPAPVTQNNGAIVKVIGIAFGAVVGFFILMVVIGTTVGSKREAQPSHVSTAIPTAAPQQQTVQPSEPQIIIPELETKFIKTIATFSDKYDEAANELQKSSVRSERSKALQAILRNNTKFDGWVGRVKDMGTNSDGDAYLSIKLEGSELQIQTWNNAISDYADYTLIKHGNPLYNAVAQLEKGALVEFGGRFLKDQMDYVKEGSATEAGSMRDPEFIVRFSSVKKR